MIYFYEASLQSLSVHHVGNKLQDEYFTLSNEPIDLEDDTLKNLLLQYFLNPFLKTSEVFNFYHPSGDLEFNNVFSYVKSVFENVHSIHHISEVIATRLYGIANHPKIKAGELHVVYFKDVQIEGELVDAIGIFKSENKETYLMVFPDGEGFEIGYEQDAIGINNLDKGCLIFNSDADKGYKVVVVDQSKNKNDVASYWKDEFLGLQIRNDNHTQTTNLLGVYKHFIDTKLDEDFEISKTDKIDLLNKSIKYFKEKESFDLHEFGNEVFADKDVIESFKAYKTKYEAEFETTIQDSFDISDTAVKAQARNFKSVIKLDKNFHIYLHGNKELIERGFDDDKGLNFYKVYFRDEA